MKYNIGNSGGVVNRQKCLNIKSILLTLIIFVTSWLNYFKIREVFWAVELPPYLFCAIICFFTAIATVFSKAVIHVTIIDLVIFIYFIYTIFSAYILAYPFTPADRIYDLFGCMVFYVWIRVASFFSSGTAIATYGILLPVLIQAVSGLLEHVIFLPSYNGRSGIQGGFINPAIYGCFMAIGLILTLHLIIIYKGAKSGLILLGFAGVLIATSLLLSLSRTAYIASFSVILMTMFFHLKARYNSLCIRFRYLLIGYSAVVLISVVYYLWQKNTLSVSGRFLIWKISFLMFMDHPIFGIGYSNFFTTYGNYQSAYFQSGKGTLQEIQTAGLNYYPFNELLKVAIENGIIGLGLFLSIIITCIKSCRQIKAKDLDIMVFIAILVVILIFGMFSYPLQSDAINCIFYFCIAAIASFQIPLYQFELSRIKMMFLSIPVLILLALSMRKIDALMQWRKMQSSIVYAEGDALRTYERIYHALDDNGAFLFNYGAILSDMGANKKSLEILRRAQRYLSSMDLITSLAAVNSRMQKYEQAQQYYLTAAYMDPKRFVPFDNLFVFYEKTGQIIKAQNVARLIIKKTVKIPSSKVTAIKEAARQYLLISQKQDTAH